MHWLPTKGRRLRRAASLPALTPVKAFLPQIGHPSRMAAPPTVTLEAKVAFLSRPEAYLPRPREVEARETNMSWVFLTPDRVYKLKKPNRRPFLDFSTIRRRRFFCEEEVRLNRRLAAETYLGVRALRHCPDGLSLGDRGRTVDWLVEMRRLDSAQMLDHRLGAGGVGAVEIEALAERLVAFYRGLAPQVADGHLYIAHLRQEQAVNRAMLSSAQFGLGDGVADALDATDAALDAATGEIEARIGAGLIVEGHGDLRPEHVWIGKPLQIFDCLEFSRPMRILDPYDEVNYLGLECELLGAGWIRWDLLGVLTARLGNPPSDRLLRAYGAFRALLRARLSVAHLLQTPVRKPAKWLPQAQRYIAQARREIVSSPCRPGRRSIPRR